MQAIDAADLAELSPAQMAAFKANQIAALSDAQIAALDSTQFSAISAAAVVGLTAAQITGLDVDKTAALTPKQVSALRPAQLAVLTDIQLQSISETAISGLTAAQMPGLGVSQITALTNTQIGALSPAALGALSSPQVQAIDVADLAELSPAQMAAFKSTQIAALTDAQIAALDSTHLSEINAAAVAGLTTARIAALSVDKIAALTPKQVAALKPAQIGALTGEQLQSLVPAQVKALTPQQLASVAPSLIPKLSMVTPIVLDLNGDGVKTLSIADGVKFDLLADGKNINTGWVSHDDGLLVLDRNSDGVVNDGSELFGSATKLANGQAAHDGYTVLRTYDTNQDNVVDKSDAIWDTLKVWVDGNSDGLTGVGELRTLDSLGIKKLNLNAAVGTDKDNGNLLGLVASYETTAGATHAAADVWFAADKGGAQAQAGTLDAAIAALNGNMAPELQMAAESAPTLQTISLPVLTQGTTLTSADAKNNLTDRVSSMAQAMTAFNYPSDTSNAMAIPTINAATNPVQPTIPTLAAVAAMVDVMKQFDSHGSQTAVSMAVAPSTNQSLTLPGLKNPDIGGTLFSR